MAGWLTRVLRQLYEIPEFEKMSFLGRENVFRASNVKKCQKNMQSFYSFLTAWAKMAERSEAKKLEAKLLVKNQN